MKCRLIPALALPFLLTACGGGDSAIDGAREIPNRFGNTVNALDDFNPGSTGGIAGVAGAAGVKVVQGVNGIAKTVGNIAGAINGAVTTATGGQKKGQGAR